MHLELPHWTDEANRIRSCGCLGCAAFSSRLNWLSVSEAVAVATWFVVFKSLNGRLMSSPSLPVALSGLGVGAARRRSAVAQSVLALVDHQRTRTQLLWLPVLTWRFAVDVARIRAG